VSRFPKTYKANMRWRKNLLRRAEYDLAFRERLREQFFRDPIFAFNAFFFTLDPRKKPKHQQPFCTYKYQDEGIAALVQAINNGHDLGVEKSRDMGVTWIVILTFLWFWLNPAGGADFLLGSRIEDYVDKKGDPRTHFEKVRYALYRLPGWLRPAGFHRNKHDNFMRIVNPKTGASITGESNNANFSTQGRYNAILFDEFAKWEHTDKSAWTAAGDASPCRIPISTPFGAGGQYYDVVSGGKTKILRFHWSLHPEKKRGLYCEYPPPNWQDKQKLGDKYEPEVKLRSIWYDEQCVRRSPTEIAQELDIDYIGAGRPVFDRISETRSLKYFRTLDQEPSFCCEVQFDQEPTLEPVASFNDMEGLVQIYEKPAVNGCYIISADVVEGKEDGDFNSVKVYNRDTKSVDASYYSRVSEIELAYVLRAIHSWYSVGPRQAYTWTSIETIGPGISTFDLCLEAGLPNLFMMPRFDTTKGSASFMKGWKTTSVSRNALVSAVREWLQTRPGFMDARCAWECMTFIKNKMGKPIAKGGCHDDEVFSFGIAVKTDEYTPYDRIREEVERRPDGLPVHIFDKTKAERVPEPSIEERCFAQALEKKESVDMIQEAMFDAAEDLFDNMGVLVRM